eukprot:SAG31_NODE_16_length_36206_cov_27.355728_29_plen_221_part_00
MGSKAASGLLGLPAEFVLWDTEFTAWEGSWKRGWSEDWEHREIICIAAIRVRWDAVDNGGGGGGTKPALRPLGRFSLFVRPHVNAELSDYITALTGITQADVDGGVELVPALESFRQAKLLSRFYATIREIRDFDREIYGTNRESVCINRQFCAQNDSHLPQYCWGGDEPVEECIALHAGVNTAQFSWLQQVDIAPVFQQLLPEVDLDQYSSGTIHKVHS